MLAKEADAVDDVVFAQFEFDGFRPSVQSHDCDRGFMPASPPRAVNAALSSIPVFRQSFPAPSGRGGDDDATQKLRISGMYVYHAVATRLKCNMILAVGKPEQKIGKRAMTKTSTSGSICLRRLVSGIPEKERQRGVND